MINAEAFITHAGGLGYTHYSGVPCSYLKPFINYVIGAPGLNYVGASSEGEAVGISMGAYLAGRRTVTMCQNSGLGNMVNPLTSLNYPFRIPTLLIVTWRGEPGFKDEPQHEQMGRIMHRLLETLEIPWREFPREESEIGPAMAEVERSIEERSGPFALVMSQDTVAPHALAGGEDARLVTCRREDRLGLPAGKRLSRTEAIRGILEALNGDEAIIGTTGKTGRELFTLEDRPGNLYVVGGMGTASAIGLGVAQVLPHQPVVVLDGDGAALMKMGVMPTIGYQQPENLLHVILDNEVHDSTGGQRTVSGVVRFTEVAAGSNYRNAWAVDSETDLLESVKELRRIPGPSLLHLKIRPGSPKELGRPTVKPHEVKERFMEFLRTSNQAS